MLASAPGVHDFAFVKIEWHLPLLRALNNLVKVLLNDDDEEGDEDEEEEGQCRKSEIGYNKKI